MRINVLGVGFDNVTMAEATARGREPRDGRHRSATGPSKAPRASVHAPALPADDQRRAGEQDHQDAKDMIGRGTDGTGVGKDNALLLIDDRSTIGRRIRLS